MQELKDREGLMGVNFTIDRALYARFKTIAVSKRITLKNLLVDVISEYVASHQHEPLIEQFMAVPAVERMALIHQINKDEVEDDLKERVYAGVASELTRS